MGNGRYCLKGACKRVLSNGDTLTLPKTVAEFLGDELLLFPNILFNKRFKYLYLFNEEGFEKFADAYLGSLDVYNSATLNAYERSVDAVYQASICVRKDSRNRIVIPKDLRKHAELERVVYLTAAKNVFKIWAEHQFEMRNADTA